MIRPDSSLLSLIPLRLAAATLFAVSCAPASEAPVQGTGGSFSTGGITGGTTGGISGTTGGTFSNTGGTTSFTGGTSTGTTGGNKATGGTTTATGGTTTATGGTTTATGGTTTSTGGTSTTATGGTASATGGSGGSTVSGCATYDGTTATASKIFTDGFGKSTTGTWQGYAYTYTYGTGAVIKPGSSTTTSCFKAAQMCANGTVPALDSAGVGVGWNISQPMGGTAMAAPITTAVKITTAGAKAGMRVALGPVTGDEYCRTLTAADVTLINGTGLTLPLTEFKQYCYDAAKAMPYMSTTPIKSIQVAVPGSTTGGAQTFDFCLVDIEPG